MKKLILFLILSAGIIYAIVFGCKILTPPPTNSIVIENVPTPEVLEVVADEIPQVDETRKEIITYTVKTGDTLSSIAKQFDLTIETVLGENNLIATSMIKPGQKLSILPFSGMSYKVKSGDTLSRISKDTGIDSEKIIESNELSDNGALKIGQLLIIPGAVKKVATVKVTTPVKAKTVAPVVTTPKNTTPITTSTSSSTTLTSVTWTSAALAEVNKIPSLMRSAVKAKVTNYAKTHGIPVITLDIYNNLHI